MLKRLRSALSYSNVVATIALFIALAGSAYATKILPPKSVGTKQLKKNAVTSAKIKNGQVRSVDVSDEGLTGADILNGSVGSFEIGDGVITGPKIAEGAVAGASLADGAITGAKIADGTVGPADLDPNAIGDIISIAGTFPNDGTARKVLELPGFGKFTMSCSGADSVNLFYALEKGAQQNARLKAHDSFDDTPKGAAAISSSAGGGVGYGGSGHNVAAEGNLFVFTDDQVLQVDFSLTPNSCVYRLRATLDRNET